MGRHEAFRLFSISLLIWAPRMFQRLKCLHMKQVNNAELILEKRFHQILAINYYRFPIMVSLNKAIDQNKTKRISPVLHSSDNSICVFISIGTSFNETLHTSEILFSQLCLKTCLESISYFLYNQRQTNNNIHVHNTCFVLLTKIDGLYF